MLGQQQRLGWAWAFSLFAAWLKGTFVWCSETLQLGACFLQAFEEREMTFFHPVLGRRGAQSWVQ